MTKWGREAICYHNLLYNPTLVSFMKASAETIKKSRLMRQAKKKRIGKFPGQETIIKYMSPITIEQSTGFNAPLEFRCYCRASRMDEIPGIRSRPIHTHLGQCEYEPGKKLIQLFYMTHEEWKTGIDRQNWDKIIGERMRVLRHNIDPEIVTKIRAGSYYTDD